jgi:hypothetical protein
MPRYLVSQVFIPGSCPNPQEDCQSSITFFSKMSEKLLNMVKSLKKQFEACSKPTTQAKGAILAQIDTPQMVLGVKIEYLEYIKRFGPPSDGIFEENKLKQLRAELGISENNSGITL